MIKCISIFAFIVLNLTCFGQKMNRFSIDVNGSGIKYFLDDNYSSKLNLGFNSNFNYYLNNKYKISLGAGAFNKDYIRYTGSNQNKDVFEHHKYWITDPGPFQNWYTYSSSYNPETKIWLLTQYDFVGGGGYDSAFFLKK
jgi:hypothetical protein